MRILTTIMLCIAITSTAAGQVTSNKSKSGIVIETEGFVDLGLPSGTLWGACNIGASKPEESGGYYAWGEILVKHDYYWENYFDTKDYVF